MTFFTSCTNQNSTALEVDEATSIKGDVYFYTLKFDSTNCSVYSACDCCSSRMLFLPNYEFIAINYCTGDESYHKGKYALTEDSLFLDYYPQYVLNEYNWEIEFDTTGAVTNEYNIKIEEGKGNSISLNSFYCSDNLCFSIIDENGSYYGVKDTIPAAQLIQNMKTDGIWDKL